MPGPQSRHRRALRRLCALGALALACLGAAPAHAARNAEVSLIDDQLLLGASEESVERSIARIKALGVDRLRVSAFWQAHAPAGARRPAGFDGGNPFDPLYSWAALDRVVVAAARAGLKVMISISPPAPLWATGRPAAGNPVFRLNAVQFGLFAQAVAARYGTAVDHYGLSNEPNQGAWLQPQSENRRLKAPHLYRDMALAAYPRIKAADPTSTVLLGELASSGRDGLGRTRPIRPIRFLREMACVNRRYRPIRTGPCKRFRPIPADAQGHHPYAFFTAPGVRARNRDDAGIGDSRRLLRALDRLTRTGRIKPSRGRRLNVYYTEFGYQTDPPDPFAGIPVSRQNRYLQTVAYNVWRTPRIREINQFRLTDGRVNRAAGFKGFNEFQSGLMFRNGRPKPAFRSFPTPLVIDRGRIWGQARPGGAHRITLEYRAKRSGPFRRAGTTRTNSHGYFRKRMRVRPGFYRFRYAGGGASGVSPALRTRR